MGNSFRNNLQQIHIPAAAAKFKFIFQQQQ
jgi:hypothetical protein